MIVSILMFGAVKPGCASRKKWCSRCLLMHCSDMKMLILVHKDALDRGDGKVCYMGLWGQWFYLENGPGSKQLTGKSEFLSDFNERASLLLVQFRNDGVRWMGYDRTEDSGCNQEFERFI